MCVVDENLKVVYESLVLPKGKVTNYLTKYIPHALLICSSNAFVSPSPTSISSLPFTHQVWAIFVTHHATVRSPCHLFRPSDRSFLHPPFLSPTHHRYSGISEETLAGVTIRLKDVQKALRSILPPDAILVGQSLNYDLKALKVAALWATVS